MVLASLLAPVVFLMLTVAVFAQNDNRVPFRHRVGNPVPEGNLFRIRGDFTIIGNTNLTVSEYSESANNALGEMIYVDVDSDHSTFNSSSATLVFSQENGADPNCSEILYAGLYWSGRAEMGIGMTFDVTKETIPGTPQDVDDKIQVVGNGENVDYSSYSLEIISEGWWGNLYPQYILRSSKGHNEIWFMFTNSERDGVLYYTGEGDWEPVSNLNIETLGSVTTATFDPISFTERGVTFTIDRLSRTAAGPDVEDFTDSNNSMRVRAMGTYIPLSPHTAHFDKRKVKLKAPGASEYTEIMASGNHILFPHEEFWEMYVGYADVTELIRSHGTGEYTVADIALSEGRSDQTGFYGHWGLIVVYQNDKMDWRDLTLFDGYSFVQALDFQHHAGEIEINGFGTVSEGQVDLKLGVMAGEGDRIITGDVLEIINNSGEWVPLSHQLNTTENFFNSSIYTPVRDNEGTLVETPRNPSFLNNTGIDIAVWDVPNPGNSIIANGQTSTRFRYGTNQDVYVIYALAFSVLSYAPEIQGYNQLVSIDGENPGEDPSVRPGQEITYRLEIRNFGNEVIDETRIVIPIPHTATFVSTSVWPADFGTVTFDPDMGLAGSIIWEMGEVPLMTDLSEVIATLQYTLKVTEDCFVLANTHCEAALAITGGISGTGSVSKNTFTGIPFIHGFLEGACSGNQIQGPLEIPIVGRSEYAATHCLGHEFFSSLEPIDLPDFCQGQPPVDLADLIPASQEGYTVYFFTQETGGTPLSSYNVNTAVPGTEQVWVSEGPIGSCTGLRIPISVRVNSRSPMIPAESGWTCDAATGSMDYPVTPTPGYLLLYYEDNNPESPPLTSVPTVDLTSVGVHSVWVSQIKEGECESRRQEVSVTVEDCSMQPFIEVRKTADVDSFSKESDVITYTIAVENVGRIRIIDVNIYDELTTDQWTLPYLDPGESQDFSTSYVVTSWDLENGYIMNVVNAWGRDDNGLYASDWDEVEIEAIGYPPGFLNYEITPFSEICLGESIGTGAIEITFLDSHQSGSVVLVKQEDGEEFTVHFENENIVRIELPPGEYAMEMQDDSGNTLSIPMLYSIEKRDMVDFTAPSELIGCAPYPFAPQSSHTLTYRLIGPGGQVIPLDGDGYFRIEESGAFRIIAEDPSGQLCPLERAFQAFITTPSSLNLEVMPFCGEDVFTTITLQDETDGLLLKWYRIDILEPFHLVEYDNSPTLTVQEDAVYEVTLTDEEGCVVGKNRIEISRSVTSPPLIENLYTICKDRGVQVFIEAGTQYDNYRWLLHGEEVSNSSLFIPEIPGAYTLVAADNQGCEFFVDFTVEDGCDPMGRFPNSVRPGIPEKAFKVFVNNLVDELEVFIHNRWGELIYFCEDRNLSPEHPSSCLWDGMVNGRAVPNGTYLVHLRYKNRQQDLIVTEKGGITVMD